MNLVAVIAAVIAVVAVCAGVYALCVIPVAKMFEKAGEEGWKAYIPLYSSYVFAKLVWKESVFWIMLALGVINAVLQIIGGDSPQLPVTLLFVADTIAVIVYSAMLCSKASKAYGHGAGYAVGLFFLPLIFEYIIGFGSSEYAGTQQNTIN